MAQVILDQIVACETCYQVCANGTRGMEDETAAYHSLNWLQAFEKQERVHLVPGDDLGFKRYGCFVCDDESAGDKYQLVGLR